MVMKLLPIVLVLAACAEGAAPGAPALGAAPQDLQACAVRPNPVNGEVAGLNSWLEFDSVFHRAPDGNVRRLWRTDDTYAWGPWHWETITSQTTFRAAEHARFAPVLASDGTLTVFFRSTTNRMVTLSMSLEQPGNGWVATDLGGNVAGDPSVYPRVIGGYAVVYRLANNHLRQVSWTSSGVLIIGEDLTSITGAPLATSDPTATKRCDGYNSIVFNSAAGVAELYWSGGAWAWGNPQALAGAPAATSRPFVYPRGDGSTAIVYRNGGRIIELHLLPVGWRWQELTAGMALGNNFAVGDPVAHARFDGYDHVLFRSWSGKLIELTSAGSTWQWWNLTDSYGAGPALTDPSLFFIISMDAEPILFGTSANHAGDVLWRLDGGWSAHDLSALAGEP